MTGAEVAKLIDHTLLRPEAARQDIEALCRDAVEFGFLNVCVNPTWVSLAARLVAGSGVGVCAVVGFPFGATPTDVIIETALLTDDEKATASTLAKTAGADFVKTSTGFAAGGATA